MKLPKIPKLLLTTFSILILYHPLFGQKLAPKERIQNEPDHIISSKITERDYLIHMSFPENYTINDTITYPVLYVLDGKSTHRYFNAEHIEFKKIQDVILVGISHKANGIASRINRFNDYTPYSDTISDRKFEKKFGVQKGTLKTGGASKFLECVKKEIIPFIDKHYKTNTDRGISGHSLGGLFTVYCFLISDNYFTRFGINSPSFQLNDEIFLEPSITTFRSNDPWDISPTKVFISTGENESPELVSNMVKFSLTLKKRNYENVDMDWRIYRNESHTSVVPFSLNGTLTALYGRK